MWYISISMQILKTRLFNKWAIDIGLEDASLIEAVEQMQSGLYKKRIGLNSRGKSGGLRTIIAFKMNDKAFFLYGFAKNSRGNIDFLEKEAFRDAGKVLLSFDDSRIGQEIKNGKLFEVKQ